MKNKKAFTLIELLIVIAIIGILAGVVLVSTNDGRKKARDAQRKSDVNQISKALYLHWLATGSFNITSDCSSGAGIGYGFINSTYALCNRSINQLLVSKSFFTSNAQDPNKPTNVTLDYMLGGCSGGRFTVYARLENPTSDTDATMTRAINAPFSCSNYADARLGGGGSYFMNYAVIVD